MKEATYLTAGFLVLLAVVASPASAQSIQTDGNIETDAQLVSNVATGTAPLAVSSTTMVPSLNADQVDGVEGTELALDTDLQNVETLLTALQDQVDALTPQLIGPALVPATGQTNDYGATGSDGDLERGIVWPNPRFTDNGNGTVTDNLTGLIWLDDANCFGTQAWADALTEAAALFDGCTDCGGTDNDCGLSDSSGVGAWRLPNLRELQSLVYYGVFLPAVPNTAGTGQWQAGDAFSGVQSDFYWSSTTVAISTGDAWVQDMANGNVTDNPKTTSDKRVWPVRGGQ